MKKLNIEDSNLVHKTMYIIIINIIDIFYRQHHLHLPLKVKHKTDRTCCYWFSTGHIKVPTPANIVTEQSQSV